MDNVSDGETINKRRKQMSAQSISPPFTIYQDIDGQPLESGMIYIGTAGLNAITNQIPVYWDVAMTISASQPLRTKGGYLVNGGSPGTIYVNADDYSISVNNKHNTTVTSSANVMLRDSSSLNIEDFGALTTASAAINTAAIHAAIAAANAQGGGVVIVPPKTYTVSEITFGTANNVILQGEMNGINYGNAKGASNFSVESGVYGLRIPDTSSYCGMRDISFTSNGLLSGTAPHVATTEGTEYGIVIETGSTLMERVTVYGFQYGCTITNGGNSNIFTQCSFIWNTKVGFGCTHGSASVYAAMHPNLSAPSAYLNTTVYTMSDCVMRRNGWGMVLRDGQGVYNSVVVEANYFGGVYQYHGSLDSGLGGKWNQCYFESNWLLYDNSASYTVTQNNYFKETASTWVPFTTGTGNSATDDAGYQFYMASYAGGINSGPSYQYFYNMNMVQGSSGVDGAKGLWLKSCTHITFMSGGISSGDQTNSVRLEPGLSDGLGNSWSANQVVFFDAFLIPAPVGGQYGNRCFRLDYARTGAAGLIAEGQSNNGYFQGLYGNLAFPATQVDSVDANTLDDYEEGTFTPTFVNIGTGTYGAVSGTYTKIGNLVTCSISIAMATLGSASGQLIVSGLPFAIGADAAPISSAISASGVATQRSDLVGIGQTTTVAMAYASSAASWTHADLGATATIKFSVTYRV
jgi:hypothetical protein